MSRPFDGNAHPLRPISFGDPACHDRTPRRRHHLSAPENRARRLPGTADRPAAPLGQAGAEPHFHGGARRGWRLAADHLRTIIDLKPAYRFRPARARPFGGKTDRHSLRQFGRPRAGGVRCAVCGYSVLSGIPGLFAGVEGLRQARLSDEAADAGLVFAEDAGKFADAIRANIPGDTEIVGLARRRARPRCDDARRLAGVAGASAPRCRA